MKRALLTAAAVWLVSAGTAWPLDHITTVTSQHHFGRITSMSAVSISFEPQRGVGPTEIPVNEVSHIIFDSSPDSLLAAQKNLIDGDYEKALDSLKKESLTDKRREVAEEINFTRAYCMAMLALSGAKDPIEAGKQMYAFLADSPNSFHYYKACELMGDVFVTLGKFADAEKYYGLLSKAPWPDCKIRAQVALGRSYLAQDKAAAADKAFDDALSIDATGEPAETQRTAARIGKVRCMILGGKTDQALRSLNEILDKSEDKPPEINAMVYNALGSALRKAGKPKEAIRAFLHVHLEFNSQPDLDAEAVANLERLFIDTHSQKHAQDMRHFLNEHYGNSRWAKGVK